VITWTHGNGFLGLLEHGPVDIVVTDAPYAKNVYRDSRRSSSGAHEAFDLGHAAITPALQHAMAFAIASTVQRWTLLFTDLEEGIPSWRALLERYGQRYMGTGIWDKTNATPQLTGDRGARDYEAYLIMHTRRKSRWNGGGRGILERHPTAGPVPKRNGRDVRHPTEKPLGLIERLIKLYSDPGEIVADPFGGRATTATACKRTARSCVSWELDAWFHECGQIRLDETEPGIVPLFSDREELADQLGLDRWAELDEDAEAAQ
jgi:site-specific DNA-methyltransferase (adenine-specific)